MNVIQNSIINDEYISKEKMNVLVDMNHDEELYTTILYLIDQKQINLSYLNDQMRIKNVFSLYILALIQRYDSTLSKEKLSNSSFDTTLKQIAMNVEFNTKDFKSMIEAHSNKCLTYNIEKIELNQIEDMINVCIASYNVNSYKILLNNGYTPSYFNINNMLCYFKKCEIKEFYNGWVKMQDMIRITIEHGIVLDLYQANMLESIDKEFYNRIHNFKLLENKQEDVMRKTFKSITSKDYSPLDIRLNKEDILTVSHQNKIHGYSEYQNLLSNTSLPSEFIATLKHKHRSLVSLHSDYNHVSSYKRLKEHASTKEKITDFHTLKELNTFEYICLLNGINYRKYKQMSSQEIRKTLKEKIEDENRYQSIAHLKKEHAYATFARILNDEYRKNPERLIVI